MLRDEPSPHRIRDEVRAGLVGVLFQTPGRYPDEWVINLASAYATYLDVGDPRLPATTQLRALRTEARYAHPMLFRRTSRQRVTPADHSKIDDSLLVPPQQLEDELSAFGDQVQRVLEGNSIPPLPTLLGTVDRPAVHLHALAATSVERLSTVSAAHEMR